MKAFAIDASTTLKWVFKDEISSDNALYLQKLFFDEKIELLAPNLWVFEIANGIKTAHLRDRVPLVKCKLKLKQLIKSSPYLVNIEDEVEACLNNAFKYQISVYDSAYVTLAIINEVPLISSDNKLVKKIANQKIALNLVDFTNNLQ